MPVMFSEIDLDQQQRLKCAFDAQGLLNPGKVFPEAASLRRAWPHARSRRQGAVPGHSAVLSTMRFGLFGSAQASTQTHGPETGQGFRDYLDLNVEAEALGFDSSFLVEHHFTGWNQVSATLMLLTCLAMRTTTAAAWHRRDRAALAQPGAARRAGRHARPDFRRPVRFRRRQGLPAQRVPRLSDPAGGGAGALRGGDRGDDPRLDRRASASRTGAGSGSSTTSWSSRRPRRSRIRRSGLRPAATPRSVERPSVAST